MGKAYKHVIMFQTEMKLGSVNKIRNKARLNSIIRELKLNKLKGCQINSLSGGERRLLSLATSVRKAISSSYSYK